MFGIGAPSVESKVAAANNVEELVKEMRQYARRLQKDKRLPADIPLATDLADGAMIALAGLLRLTSVAVPKAAGGFSVKPRLPLIDA